MEKTKVIQKGYTITVVSWENDGDNYRTKSMVVDSKEKALAIKHMCETIFKSCNGGIGNMMDDEGDKAFEVILPYMKAYPDLYDNKDYNDGELLDICLNLNYELMGGSTSVASRVCESVRITYSPEDIYVETIH